MIAPMFRAVAMAAVVLAGCAPAPAERLHNPRRIEPPPRPASATRVVTRPLGQRAVAMPRPELPQLARVAAPDPTEYLRWPLTANRHPVLEPAYAIAPAFAAPEMSWIDLCRLGAQNRRASGVRNEQLEYLRAWCSVAKRDTYAAVAQLGPLLRSTVAGIPAAVRDDVANILVDGGGADLAQASLAKARISDLVVYDTLAASYAEVGKLTDAITFNDVAIDAYDFKRPADHCHRLVRRILLSDPGEHTKYVKELSTFSGDPACAKLAHELECWHGDSCDPYLVDQGIDPKAAELAELYASWPQTAVGADVWWMVAKRADDHIHAPGADALVTAALEATLLASRCRGDLIHDVRAYAFDISTTYGHDTSLDARLKLIAETPAKLCDAHP